MIEASSTLFFALAVGAGFVLIGVVAYGYVRPRPDQRTSVTALLGLLGFALIASPNFTSISIRSGDRGLELELIREMQVRQLEAISSLTARSGSPSGSADEPERAATHRSPPGPAGAAAAPAGGASTPSATPSPPPASRAQEETGTALSDEDRSRLFAAFARGELELSQLTNEELLILNEEVTARASLRARGARPPREASAAAFSQ